MNEHIVREEWQKARAEASSWGAIDLLENGCVEADLLSVKTPHQDFFPSGKGVHRPPATVLWQGRQKLSRKEIDFLREEGHADGCADFVLLGDTWREASEPTMTFSSAILTDERGQRPETSGMIQ